MQLTRILYQGYQTWLARLNLLANQFLPSKGNDNVMYKVLTTFHHDLLCIIQFDRKSKKRGCKIFNIQNVSHAKYSYSNIDNVTMTTR